MGKDNVIKTLCISCGKNLEDCNCFYPNPVEVTDEVILYEEGKEEKKEESPE